MLDINLFANSWRKSFTLEGRANRREFWNYQILMGILAFTAALVVAILDIDPISYFITLLLMISVFPSFSLGVRRCHDINLSGFFVLATLIPVIGQMIYYIAIGGIPTQNKGNKYNISSVSIEKI